MNRLILIGNGFDLAHGLPTRYEDFIGWYWRHRINKLAEEDSHISDDKLCSFVDTRKQAWSVTISLGFNLQSCTTFKALMDTLHSYPCFKIHLSPFFSNICKSIETKGWVDIENEYYNLLKSYSIEKYSIEDIHKLNEQLFVLQELLILYLNEVNKQSLNKKLKSIQEAIYAPIHPTDLSVADQKSIQEHIDYWRQHTDRLEEKIVSYGLDARTMLCDVRRFQQEPSNEQPSFIFQYPDAFMLPDCIMFLNFNYTSTAHQYLANHNNCFDNHIHGDIRDMERQEIIFGYGDELDANFSKLQNLNNNECLRNVKSMRYLENSNYKNALTFMASAPFQVYIMGHSCGNSDRTLLNTIFEHKNCVSIKPYYYIKDDGTDNYIDIIQNVSRNFTDMKLMRDRVVNKTLCNPLVNNK